MATENPTPRPRPKRVYPPGHWSKYAKTKRAKRLAAGLCVTCGKPRGDNPVTCDPCLQKLKERGERYRAAARAVRPPTPPRVKVVKDMAAYKRAWRAKRKATGVCTTCGGPRDVPGRVRCWRCRVTEQALYGESQRARYHRRAQSENTGKREERKRWEAEGKCTWCGGDRDRPDKKRCSACYAKADATQKAVKAERKRLRLCRRCGRKPERGATCEACLTKHRREYLRTDPDKIRAKLHRRRARIAGNGGSFTADDWKAIKRAQGYRCLICLRKEPEIKLTVDHVIPLAQGGTSDPGNIAGLCLTCNLKKGPRYVEYRKLASEAKT